MITALTRTGPPPEGLIICAPPQSPTPAPPSSSRSSRSSRLSRSSRTSGCHGHQRRPSQHPRPSTVNHPCHHDSHNSRPGSQPAILAPLIVRTAGLSVPPRHALLSLLPPLHPAEPAALLTASVPIILGPVQQLLPKIYYQRITPELPHIAHVCSKIILMSSERAFNHRII